MQRASLVISSLALFVALGGPGQAQKITSALKKDEVRTQHIRTGHVISGDLKNNGVKSIDIRDKGVTTADLADGAVGLGQIAPSSIRGFQIDDGTLTVADVSSASGADTEDFGTIGAHDCETALVEAPGADGGDQPIVTPTSAGAFNPAATPVAIYAQSGAGPNAFTLVVCNLTAANLNPPPIGFRYLMVGN